MAQNYNYDIVLGTNKHITQDGSVVATMNSLAPAYDNTATYAVGDLCNHEGKLYSCTTAIATAEEWDATHWTETTLAQQLQSQITDAINASY